jgi:hypothetical protein
MKRGVALSRLVSLASLAALIAGAPRAARADEALVPAPAANSPKSKLADPSGTPIRVTSTNLDTDIYLAKGDIPENPVYDVFERIGTAPLEIRLAPGVYTIQSSNPTSSMGHARFHVEAGHPIDIEVRNGDATMRTLGGVCEGLGVTAMLLGVLAIIAISPHDDNYNRFGIGLPLLLGGAGMTGLGVGLSFAGATNIKMPTSSLHANMLSVTVSF